MAVRLEGTPCWADATFDDVEAAKAAKAFYGDVLGWTFGASSEFGDHLQAYADGKAVAAVVPGQEGPSQWCLYLAVRNAAATAVRIGDNGGELLREPMRVGDFGTMCPTREPGGAVFGLWQAGIHLSCRAGCPVLQDRGACPVPRSGAGGAASPSGRRGVPEEDGGGLGHGRGVMLRGWEWWRGSVVRSGEPGGMQRKGRVTGLGWRHVTVPDVPHGR
ncbi:VOC family protein, partial [Streptomyces sp. NPDC127091]|uniref:VOC family protein n=1 Tax=Streptomyces sp. NPDC127091 TaxID=3347134 RepID=UPI003650238B